MTLTPMEQLARKAMADAGVDPALARKAIQDICLEKRLYEGTNSVASVEFFKEPREKDCVLELAEGDRLLAECAEPLKTMVLVGLHCGVRMRSEILTLQWTNLDLPRRTLTVAASYSKNGKARTVSLNSTVLAALERHREPAT
jgi:integrase